MDSEKCLNELGGDNKWILFWFFIISYMKSLPSVFSMLSFQFTAFTPDSFHCAIPNNVSMESMIPKELINGIWKYSSCKQFQNQDNSTIVPCQHGYNYSMKYFTSSIVTEWDLVCERTSLKAITTSLFFVMSFLGAIISCNIADRYGRKLVLITSFTCLNIFEFLQTYITNLYLLIFTKLVTGIFQQGCYISGFTMTMELFSVKNRSNACLVDTMAWTISSFILVIYVYLIRDWRSYFFWTSITMLPFVASFYHMPESIRWLINKNKVKEAQALLRKASKYSNPPLPKETFDDSQKFKVDKSETLPVYNITHICKEMLLLRYQLVNTFIWLTTAMTYYGLQIKVVEIGNPFLNFFLSALVEVPACIFCFPISNKYGRKSVIGITNILVCICIIGGFVLYKKFISPWPAIFTFLFGKMLNTGIFNLIFLHVTEIYPTTLRTTGAGMSSSAARVGASIGSLLFQINVVHDSIPFIIIAVCSFLSGILVFCLPETYRKPMPTSIEELKEWVFEKSLISFR